MNIEFFKELFKRTGYGMVQLIKGIVLSSVINFVIIAIGLKIANVPYYGLIAFAIAIADLLPVLGAGIVLIPWAIISLVTGEVSQAITLVILYVITFFVKQIIEPIILGKSIGLKPLYTLGITAISMIILSPAVGAIVGAIISVVVAAFLNLRDSKRETNDIIIKES